MKQLAPYVKRVEAALDRALPPPGAEPARLHEAMRYVCLSGGKRIRALLTYAAGHAVGAVDSSLDAPACAVELIHAYSLVHDDLPAMDDDELRRGKPTCHLAFDEATAILVGDGLQALAFELIAEARDISPQGRTAMIATLARSAGSTGMVGGQAMDIAAENQSLSLEEVKNIHRAKTGALITASVVLGALAAPDGQNSDFKDLEKFGSDIGAAFQVVDDILDETTDTKTLGKPSGSDQSRGKSTVPAVVGLEESRSIVNALYRSALSGLDRVSGDTARLRAIANLVVERSF